MDEAFADSELEGGQGDKQSKRAAQSAWVTGSGFGGGGGRGGQLIYRCFKPLRPPERPAADPLRVLNRSCMAHDFGWQVQGLGLGFSHLALKPKP